MSLSAGGGDGGWALHRRRGTAGALHALDLLGPDPVTRGVWILEAEAPAVVLGSAQRQLVEGPGVVRSSGGGAVYVDPRCSLWVDVVIGRGDPLWHEDVGRSSLWLGRCWQAALGSLGFAGEVHEGPADRHELARAACFAGVGPGEVVAGGRKLVGISQRRTRTGARFQCLAYTAMPEVTPVVAALGKAAPAGLAEALAAATGVVATAPSVLLDALLRAMMTLVPATPASHEAPDASR